MEILRNWIFLEKWRSHDFGDDCSIFTSESFATPIGMENITGGQVLSSFHYYEVLSSNVDHSNYQWRAHDVRDHTSISWDCNKIILIRNLAWYPVTISKLSYFSDRRFPMGLVAGLAGMLILVR